VAFVKVQRCSLAPHVFATDASNITVTLDRRSDADQGAMSCHIRGRWFVRGTRAPISSGKFSSGSTTLVVARCFEQASDQLDVANPCVKTAGVLEHWDRAPALDRVTADAATNDPTLIRPGAIFVIDHGNGKGHAGLVTRVVSGNIDTIEGNTSEAGSREGDGVYEKTRAVDSINVGFIDYGHTSKTPARSVTRISAATGRQRRRRRRTRTSRASPARSAAGTAGGARPTAHPQPPCPPVIPPCVAEASASRPPPSVPASTTEAHAGAPASSAGATPPSPIA
jgi:hypothetical protein